MVAGLVGRIGKHPVEVLDLCSSEVLRLDCFSLDDIEFLLDRDDIECLSLNCLSSGLTLRDLERPWVSKNLVCLVRGAISEMEWDLVRLLSDLTNISAVRGRIRAGCKSSITSMPRSLSVLQNEELLM